MRLILVTPLLSISDFYIPQIKGPTLATIQHDANCKKSETIIMPNFSALEQLVEQQAVSYTDAQELPWSKRSEFDVPCCSWKLFLE